MSELGPLAAIADRYEIHGEVGRGGMAVVYRARDLRHERDVAIKVFQPELGSPTGQARFLNEIKLSAGLQHPQIVPIYDSGAADGFLYFVMPFVRGESLRDRLSAETRLPLEEALRIMEQVGQALQYAHSNGVVHRDIKPANILLTEGGAQVADFGIAKALQEATGEQRLTGPGLAMGTPAYMSPEQGAGERQVDERADQYSLACVLYEMLVGKPLFSGPSARSVIAQHISQEPPSITDSREDVPRNVAIAMQTALQKEPDARFATVGEFLEALETPGLRPRRDRRVRPWRRGAAAVALFAVGAWAISRLPIFRSSPLDPAKVVVFPLVDLGEAVPGERSGIDFALWLGTAIEHVEPLKRYDGWQWLSAEQRADMSQLTREVATSIGREIGARYYLNGTVQHSPDSTRVLLQLWDVAGDSVTSTRSAAAPRGGEPGSKLALRALIPLLPALLDPGREFDLTHLLDRDAGAIASWIEGEREYRNARFDAALAAYREAIRQDSLVTMAALKGAQAASWLERRDLAHELVDLALADSTVLPGHHRGFASAIRGFLDGNPNAAREGLERALDWDPEWPEVWMTLGEVHYHLLQTRVDSDSVSRHAFSEALRLDPDFTPALSHLSELAIRDREFDLAEQRIARLGEVAPDSSFLRKLKLASDCARAGTERVDWGQAVSADLLGTLEAARILAVAGAFPGCAADGFRAVIDRAGPGTNDAWGALVGLQGVLFVQDKLDAALAALDSAYNAGLVQTGFLYVLNAARGVQVDGRDQIFSEFLTGYMTDRYGPEYWDQAGATSLWTLVVWHAGRGDSEGVVRLADALSARSASGEAGITALAAAATTGWKALALGDTAGAIDAFEVLVPMGTPFELAWDLWRPLAPEKMKLAELYLARGQPVQALDVAAIFDHPQPVSYLQYLGQSLEVRRRAAESLGRSALAREYEARLTRTN